MRFSTKRLSIPKKSGFTIREILIVIVIISVGLMSVITVLTNGMKYVQKTRQKVIAINLAREWMEAVYQMRDTNRMRRAWVKDACRLKINPLVDEWTPSCTGDLWFTTGFYMLQRLSTQGQEYFALTGESYWQWIDLGDGLDTHDYNFALCQQSGYWNACPSRTWTTSEGKYFRQIQWLWLYLKDINTTWWVQISCTWSWLDCWTNKPKEFRFCSKVVYVGESTGEVQFCGVITNFKWQ